MKWGENTNYYRLGPIGLFVRKRDYELYIGPWVARLILNLKPTTGFLHLEGQNRFIIFIRRFWSGWHRWDDDVDM